jgi:hypothetical protein
MCRILMFKLNDAMPLIWSCWLLQIGRILMSHVMIRPPHRYKLLCASEFSSSIAHSIIMHIVYVKYDAQIIICITSTTW